MTAPEVVPLLLTALFTGAAVHALRHGLLSRTTGPLDRVDHALHAAMALAMAAMPWAWAPELPAAPQTAFFAAAAVWFPASARHGPGRERHGPGRQRRRPGRASRSAASLRRLPYAVGMAAMAWMTLPARHPSHGTPTEGLATTGAAAHGPGHMADAAHTGNLAATAGSAAGDAVTAGLALCLLACALGSLTRDMPGLRPGACATHLAGVTPYDHFRDGVMALGTAVMLVMHH